MALPGSRRGVALLLSLLLIALLVAVTAEVVMLTASESIIQSRRDRSLAHDLAVESALLQLADALYEAPTRHAALLDDLDRGQDAAISFALGGIAIECVIADDGARFNPGLFERDDQGNLLVRKVALLSTQMPLPAAAVRLQPITDQPGNRSERRYRWFGQLFDRVRPGDLVPATTASTDSRLCWSDVLTFWGDGRIDVRRVSEPVLEAALEDIRPGLARTLLAARKSDRRTDFRAAALISIDGEIRRAVAARLAFDVRRYAVTLQTSSGADRRRWYVVATIDKGEVQVHHRSQLTW